FKEAQFGVPHNINANIQLALPLYQPQIRHGISLTQTAIELHELQYQKTEEQLFFDISNLYYNAQILYQQSEFIEGNLENANKLLKIMQLLHEYQMAIGTDVSKVKLQISQLNTQKSLIQSQTEQVLNALKLAMGIPQDSPLSIEREIIPHEAIAYPHHASLDHLLAQKQGQRLQIELQQLKDSRLPTVSLFGSFGATGYGYDKKPNSFLNIYPIGFAGLHIHYPLFDGTITKRKINQKNIELTNNQLQMNLIKDQNSMLIENAILQRQITLNAIDEVKDQISQALSVYNQTVQQHQQDIATMADILQADNIVRTAQQSYLSAIVDFLKADLELRKLTG
ncbi:MAG: TolC family protein, partial [Taibaiella sp.]|nr:TolC family protein [Taibaiella sp.]